MNNVRKSINKVIVVLSVFTSLVFVSCEDDSLNEDIYETEINKNNDTQSIEDGEIGDDDI